MWQVWSSWPNISAVHWSSSRLQEEMLCDLDWRLCTFGLHGALQMLLLFYYFLVDNTLIHEDYALMMMVTSTQNSHLTQSQLRIPRHKVHNHLSLLLDGQRQWEVTEWVELHWDFGTIRTNQSRLEQTMKNVDNDGVIPSTIVAPRLQRHLLLRHISNDLLKYTAVASAPSGGTD